MKNKFIILALLISVSACQTVNLPMLCGSDTLLPPKVPTMFRASAVNPTPCAKRKVRLRLDIGYGYGFYDYMKDTNMVKAAFMKVFEAGKWLNQQDSVTVELVKMRVFTTPDMVSQQVNGSMALNYYATNEFLKPDANTYDASGFIDRQTGNHSFTNYGYTGGINLVGQKYFYCCVPIPVDVVIGKYHPVVKTIFHEYGHVAGSDHTQSCKWAGGPIDSCSQPEGACKVVRKVQKNGTIMSYCDLNYGGAVDFSKGYGPLPGAKINQTIQACSTCACEVVIPEVCRYDSTCINGIRTYTPIPPCTTARASASCPIPPCNNLGWEYRLNASGTNDLWILWPVRTDGGTNGTLGLCRYDASCKVIQACSVRSTIKPGAGWYKMSAGEKPSVSGGTYRFFIDGRSGCESRVMFDCFISR